jgi:uncharacterized Zn-binding protein involved in type VI secretion
MPGAVRFADVCTGHGCFPSRPNIGASANVFANQRGAHRIGDPWASHSCEEEAHGSTQATGSPTVYVNGKPWARCGDSVGCGSSNLSCSSNVIING